MKKSLGYFSAVAAAAVLMGSTASYAIPLVDFKPVPTSPALPEFALSTTQFTSSVGTISSNSLNPIGGANLGGLLIETPLIVPGAIPGKVITAAGTTQFYDTTLDLSAQVMNNALSFNVPGFGQQVVQPISSGTFAIYASSSPATAGVLLLSGRFSTGGIGGVLGASTAGVQANSVVYTGGAIYDELVVALGGVPTPGDLSLSLIDLSTPVALTGPQGGQQLSPFTANATGLFSVPVVPEPGTLGWLATPGLLLLGRRRRA